MADEPHPQNTPEAAGDPLKNDEQPTTPAGDGGSNGAATLPTKVNPQIVDAVTTSNTAVLGVAGEEGAAMAYQKVSQAAAFALQDATDYMRNVMAMSMTTQGICMKLMVEHKEDAAEYSKIIGYAADAVTKAQTSFDAISKASNTVVSTFPSGK